MTSIPVSNVNRAQAAPGSQKGADGQGIRKTDAFQAAMDLFGKRNAGTEEMPQAAQRPEQRKQTVRPGKEFSGNAAVKERVARPKTKHAVKDTQLADEDAQKAQQTGEEIINLIADALELSPEEVVNAMQALGIFPVELENPNQMAALMTEALELTDTVQIVTDATLFETCTELSQGVSELLENLADELDVPKENLTELLTPQQPDKMDAAPMTVAVDAAEQTDARSVEEQPADIEWQSAEMPQREIVRPEEGTLSIRQELPNPEEAPEDTTARMQNEDPKETGSELAQKETARAAEHEEPVVRMTGMQAKDAAKIGNVTKPVTEETPDEPEHTEETAERIPRTAKADAEAGVHADAGGEKETAESRTGSRRDDAGRHETFRGVTAFAQQPQQIAAGQELAQPALEPGSAEDIMRQIGDYVRTNVTPDVKEMEIQLSPASLGTVQIHIASKNGVVTAQLTAESEAVRNALEAQVVQLKERLESQGVRIEAVEVTVASHEFERNLDENRENRQNEEAAARQTARTRRWNLSDTGDEPEGEGLTDAEQVELDMMRLGGGNLNYMV